MIMMPGVGGPLSHPHDDDGVVVVDDDGGGCGDDDGDGDGDGGGDDDGDGDGDDDDGGGMVGAIILSRCKGSLVVLGSFRILSTSRKPS